MDTLSPHESWQWLKSGKYDTDVFMPEVLQAVAGEYPILYVYMNDGSVRRVDMRPEIERGGVFSPLADPQVFRSALTVINQTAAWDFTGKRDPADVLDLDPCSLFDAPLAEDPLA